MAIQTILVTGANGQLGWELGQLAKSYPAFEFVFVDRSQLDLAFPETFETMILTIKPDCIVNTAAYTAVDKSETEKETYIFNNDKELQKNNDEDIIVNQFIYQDDNLDDAINKIALYIQNIKKTPVLPIYAWTKNKPVLFNIDNIKTKHSFSPEIKDSLLNSYKDFVAVNRQTKFYQGSSILDLKKDAFINKIKIFDVIIFIFKLG